MKSFIELGRAYEVAKAVVREKKQCEKAKTMSVDNALCATDPI